MNQHIEHAKVRFETVKQHLRENKTTYIVGASCLAVGVAGITWVIMRERHAVLQTGADGPDMATMRSMINQPYVGHPDVKPTLRWTSALFFCSNNSIGNTTVNNYSGNRGHPGFWTYCKEHDQAWKSQIKAAIDHDVSPTRMHDHLKGDLPHIAGHHLTRISA